MAKEWYENAATARRISKKIITGYETNKDGVRLCHIVYRLDTFASDALNKKYSKMGSIANIHTEQGGYQTIDTHHSDGSKGYFDTDGKCVPTNNPMDIEVEDYINGGNSGGGTPPSLDSYIPQLQETRIMSNKKNMNKSMKRRKVISEAQLRNIVGKAVRRVLREGYKSPWEDFNGTWKSEELYEIWDKGFIAELAYTYLGAEGLRKGLIVDSDWGDVPFEVLDGGRTLRLFLDTVEEVEQLANDLDCAAGDVYKVQMGGGAQTEKGYILDVRAAGYGYYSS